MCIRFINNLVFIILFSYPLIKYIYIIRKIYFRNIKKMNINNNQQKIVLDKNNNVYAVLIPVKTNKDIIYKSPYNNKTEDYYKDKWYNIYSYDEGIRISIEQDYKDYHVWEWEDTTERKFDEMLDILPPEKYTEDHEKDFEIFRMSEYLSWNITTHYLKIKEWDKYKYYVWNFDVSTYGHITNLVDKLHN